MSEQDAFVLLFDILKDLNKSYVENVMATLGFVLLAMGWIVTSDKAREFIGGNKNVRGAAIFLIVAIAIIHSAISIVLLKISHNQFEQIVDLNYTKFEYFSVYKLSIAHVALNLVMNIGAFTLLGWLVVSTRHGKEGRKEEN